MVRGGGGGGDLTHCTRDDADTKRRRGRPSRSTPSCFFSRPLVRPSLDKDFHRRPSYAELLRHPFLVKYDDVFVDMAAWAKDANTRHRINKGVLKLSTPFVPSPLAATGYVVAGRQPEVPTLASSFSALLLNGAASPVSSSATVNEPPSLI